MPENHDVQPSDWITVGKNPGTDAVVCFIHTESDEIEVVYLDDLGKATSDDVVWRDNHWAFKTSGASGGYADNYSRFSSFVAKLKRGRFR